MLPLCSTPVTVTRPGVTTYVSGERTDGASTTLTILASVQPLHGAELLNFEEGQRSKASIKVYTDTELRTLNEAAGTKADLVTWQGAQYEVQRCDPWQVGLLNHWRAYAFKVETPSTGVSS